MHVLATLLSLLAYIYMNARVHKGSIVHSPLMSLCHRYTPLCNICNVKLLQGLLHLCMCTTHRERLDMSRVEQTKEPMCKNVSVNISSIPITSIIQARSVLLSILDTFFLWIK